MKFLGIVHVLFLCQLFPREVLCQGSQRVSMQCEIQNAEVNFPHIQEVQMEIGPKGEVGPQGLPGRVDYERIDSTTDEKVKSGIKTLRSDMVSLLNVKEDKIQALQKQISSLPSPEELKNLFSQITEQLNEKEEKIQILQKQFSSLYSRQDVENLQVDATDEKIESSQTEGCGFVYKGTCYWIEIHDSRDVNYKKAESICSERRSVLAYPVDETRNELIMKEMRSKMPSGRSYVDAWTGLKINPSTGDATLPIGKSAPYVKWLPGQPDRGLTESKVYIRARKLPTDSDLGMAHKSPSYKTYGAVCQHKINERN